MHLKQVFLLAIGLCTLALSGRSQSSFSLTPDTVVAELGQDVFVMYDFSEFMNLSGTDLQMRWVRTSIFSEQGGSTSNTLGAWDIGIYDPTNIYLHAGQLDSADFLLKAITDSNDKFILHLYPRNIPGRLFVRYRIFPVDNPADSTSVVFDYTALEINSPSTELAAAMGLEVFPNPASDWLSLRNHADEPLQMAWVNAQGQRLPSFQLQPGDTKLETLQAMPAGLWFLWVKNGERAVILPQVIDR